MMKRPRWFGRVYYSNCWILALALILQHRAVALWVVPNLHAMVLLRSGYLVHFKEVQDRHGIPIFKGRKQIVPRGYILRCWYKFQLE